MSTANAATVTLEAADVVGLVRDLIANNELAPGDRLPPIRELAVQFGIKPGAVRDALLTAQAKGLVKVLPRVGAIVQSARDPHESQWVAEHLGGDFGNVGRQSVRNLLHGLEANQALE